MPYIPRIAHWTQYLSNIIRHEAKSKIELYRVGIGDMSVTELFCQMNDYIVNKNYELSFCDMVLLKIANALKLSIVILEKIPEMFGFQI